MDSWHEKVAYLALYFLFYFILSGFKEEEDHGFFLGPKDQAVDGIENIVTMCACGEGFTDD